MFAIYMFYQTIFIVNRNERKQRSYVWMMVKKSKQHRQEEQGICHKLKKKKLQEDFLWIRRRRQLLCFHRRRCPLHLSLPSALSPPKLFFLFPHYLKKANKQKLTKYKEQNTHWTSFCQLRLVNKRWNAQFPSQQCNVLKGQKFFVEWEMCNVSHFQDNWDSKDPLKMYEKQKCFD